MKYILNTQTNKISKAENFGAAFRKAPYRPCTQEEIDSCEMQELRNSKISTCKSYLQSTDWMACRQIKRGVAIPQEIIDKENLCAQAINDLEDLTTLEEIQNYDISKFE